MTPETPHRQTWWGCGSSRRTWCQQVYPRVQDKSQGLESARSSSRPVVPPLAQAAAGIPSSDCSNSRYGLGQVCLMLQLMLGTRELVRRSGANRSLYLGLGLCRPV